MASDGCPILSARPPLPVSRRPRLATWVVLPRSRASNSRARPSIWRPSSSAHTSWATRPMRRCNAQAPQLGHTHYHFHFSYFFCSLHLSPLLLPPSFFVYPFIPNAHLCSTIASSTWLRRILTTLEIFSLNSTAPDDLLRFGCVRAGCHIE